MKPKALKATAYCGTLAVVVQWYYNTRISIKLKTKYNKLN